MTTKQVRSLAIGVYRIYWKSGGHSLAAVGQLGDGRKWLAPCNWTSDNYFSPVVASAQKWKEVLRAEPIRSVRLNLNPAEK